MPDPTKIRATVNGDVVEVKMLMSHPEATGLATDSAGKLKLTGTPHYIKTVTVACNGRNVLSGDWGPAVSKNPFLTLRFKGGKQGDKITVTWHDSAGESRTDEATIS
ncbi:MAG TPA: thiosulfate oxidation carrier complex protein SoxZ [Rhodanobacteraceae bacterium]|nr:thiosulfate oxidation carrier complex protein SoxZ [Rhodanobacteraceae bacterium]